MHNEWALVHVPALSKINIFPVCSCTRLAISALPHHWGGLHRLVVLLAVQDAKDSQEQVENVQVEADGRSNFLLDVVVANNQLCVDENVAREDEGCKTAVDQLTSAAVGEEGCHEAEQDQTPESAEKVWHP